MRLFLLLALTPETGEATTVVATWGIEKKNQEVFWVDVPRIETAEVWQHIFLSYRKKTPSEMLDFFLSKIDNVILGIEEIDVSNIAEEMSLEETVNSVGSSFNGS